MKNIVILVSIVLGLGIADNLYSQAYEGFTLFSPNNSRYTYLVNMNNQVVKTWNHSRTGGYSAYLLKDGSVLRTAASSSSSLNGGGAQGIVQKYDWRGNLTWEYTYSTSSYRSHHDIEPLPNGNVLLIAWEVKTAAQSVQAGLNHSATLWPDHIVEVQPTGTSGGNIVWKWHFWDHLVQDYAPTKDNYGVVGDHPELLDINVGSTQGDWMHINGISYNPDTDQIVISSHNLNEFYVIDHSTTTQEAAGHTGGRWGKGGDILYRWGKPANYRAAGSQVFKVVHNSWWIPKGLPGEGNIMAYNNREGQGTSMVVEITPPRDSAGNFILSAGSAYGPTSPTWSYTASGFYSNHLGCNQRLPNGNTFIIESTSGYLFEVDVNGNTVWSYNRGGEIARGQRYGVDYEGLRMLSLGTIVMNEYQVVNNTFPDNAGEYEPWLELYNNTSEEIYLGGRYLSDAASNLAKWTFPIGTVIQPNSYLIVWIDGDITQGGLHTNFSLSEAGGKIYLSNIDLTIIDSVTYSTQATNLSWSRKPNGTGGFVLSTPTFGKSNDEEPPTPIIKIGFMDITINEIMAENDTILDPVGEAEDWIEFYNNTDSTIDLGGIYLSDSYEEITKWQFPDGTMLESNSYLVVWADNDTGQAGLHSNFILPIEGSELILANKDSSIIDTAKYGVQLANISFSRIPNGKGNFVFSVPTLLSSNIQQISSTGNHDNMPSEYKLNQNYPNPFNPETVISYQLPKESRVRLELFSIMGERICVLTDEMQGAGNHTYRLTTDQFGLTSGVYIYRLSAGKYVGNRKMVVLK